MVAYCPIHTPHLNTTNNQFQIVADYYNATMSVFRDTSGLIYDGVPNQFGCVYLSKRADGSHVAAVDGSAAPGSSKCAKVRVYSESSGGDQFQEMYVYFTFILTVN
jgi:hypothetical protein